MKYGMLTLKQAAARVEIAFSDARNEPSSYAARDIRRLHELVYLEQNRQPSRDEAVIIESEQEAAIQSLMLSGYIIEGV